MKVPRLKEWRETRGETQVSLAERAGVTQYTVLRAEHGENMRPSTARRLAEELGITVSDLQEQPPVPLGFAGKVEAPDAGRPSKERYAGYMCYLTQYRHPGFDYDEQMDNAVEAMRDIRRRVDEAISAGHDQLEYARVILLDDMGEIRVAVQIPYLSSRQEMDAAWEALGFPTDGAGDYAPDLFAADQYLNLH